MLVFFMLVKRRKHSHACLFSCLLSCFQFFFSCLLSCFLHVFFFSSVPGPAGQNAACVASHQGSGCSAPSIWRTPRINNDFYRQVKKLQPNYTILFINYTIYLFKSTTFKFYLEDSTNQQRFLPVGFQYLQNSTNNQLSQIEMRHRGFT